MALTFRKSRTVRVMVTETQRKKIVAMYTQLSDEVAQQADRLSHDPSVSAILKQQQLKDLQKGLNKALEKNGAVLQNDIQLSMRSVISSVGGDVSDWLKLFGLSVNSSLASVEDSIVRSVMFGKVYKEKWYLSEAIWGDVQLKKDDIQTIIAKGIAGNKSVYDIAKDLEQFVNPSAVKPWDWSKVYPGTAKVVDYNAQRLARTMISHAYQQAIERSVQYNPFVTGIQWHSSGSRPCKLCQDRDGRVYSKGEMPMDHPNGMCYWTAVTQDMDTVAGRLADWVNGEDDPEVERYIKSLQ